MQKPPKIILLIFSIVLFNLFYKMGFDITKLNLSFDNPLWVVTIVLPIVSCFGLLFGQVWAWYFIAIISIFRIVSTFLIYLFSFPNVGNGVIYLFLYHGIILWLLFHVDVTKFLKFDKDSKQKRFNQAVKYGGLFTLILIPLVWLVLALKRESHKLLINKTM
jgi:hypothetical protein